MMRLFSFDTLYQIYWRSFIIFCINLNVFSYYFSVTLHHNPEINAHNLRILILQPLRFSFFVILIQTSWNAHSESHVSYFSYSFFFFNVKPVDHIIWLDLAKYISNRNLFQPMPNKYCRFLLSCVVDFKWTRYR